MPDPFIAIVGRPNVGKSTLFNRLTGRREAIVSDVPGTTRDRIIAKIEWEGRSFTVVDTGGLEPRPQDPLREMVKAQVEVAVEQSDLIILLLDAGDGPNPMDEEVAGWLRRTEKPVLPVVNKVDNARRESAAGEFFHLGLGEPMSISAYHNLGVHDLMQRVSALLPEESPTEQEAPEAVLRLAIVGRTNVGKSMLLNAILGQERAIVSEIPGTTRDALDTDFTYDEQPVTLIDTAGIRRRGRIGRGIEFYSVLRSSRAIDRCDIALVVMDASELAAAQDAHIAGQAWEAFKGIIVVINKWDLAPGESGSEQELAIQAVRRRLHFISYVPICFTSALLGQGVDELMRLAFDVYSERMRRIPTGQVHRALMEALSDQGPPSRKGKQLRISEVRQVEVNPPTFIFSVDDPRLLHFSYERYLENRLRTTFGFTHTHLRFVFKGKS